MTRSRNTQPSSNSPIHGEQGDRQRWHAFEAPRRSQWKRLQLPFAIALLSGFVLVILWASSWLRPPRPTRFILAGAGYETNLSVPHNALGWNVLVDLQVVSNDAQTQRYWGKRLLRSGDGPQRMQIGWRPNLQGVDETNVVLMLTGHGFVGKQGPALLPEDVDLTKQPATINISDVIADLKQLPKQTNKLLIIDSCRTVVAPRLGLLTNSFSDSLRGMNDEIRKIPNLTVVVAADVDQQAWNYFQQRRTALGHYVIEGLRGAIVDDDDDGRIDASELFRYVDDELMQFAAANHNRRQNVLMLPIGVEGTQRADEFDLGVLRPGYEPSKSPTPIAASQWDWMNDFWQQQQTLTQSQPSVLRFSPHAWRRYQETLLRMESLLIAGDIANASRLRSSASELATLFESRRQLPLQSQDLSLSWRTAAGWFQPTPATVTTAATLLASTAPQDVRATYDAAAQQQITAGVSESAFADAVRRELLLRAAEDPIHQLMKNWQVIRSIGQSSETGPTELVFVQLLCQQINMKSLSPADGEVIGLAIKTILLAEQAASAAAPWSAAFASRVDAADLERRLGQDYLFVDTTTRQKATTQLNAASKTYASIMNDVAVLNRATNARDNAFAELPFYNNWTIATPPESGGEGLQIQVTRLWQSAHALDDQLNSAAAATAATPEMLSQLTTLTTQVEQIRSDLTKQNEQEQSSAFVADPSESLRRLSRAMLLPARDSESRRKLLIACIDATGAEIARGQQPAPSIEQQEKFAKLDAARAGNMVLALFGETWYNQLSGSRENTYLLTSHRLDVFGVEQSWRETIGQIGADDAQKWRELIQLNTSIDRDDMDLAMIDRVASQSRIIPCDVLAVDDDARDARQATLADAALQFAGRAWNEHWDDQGETPYYIRAAKLLTADAVRFALHPKKTAAAAAPWQKPGDFTLASIPLRNWTTEASESYHFDLNIVGENPPNGIPRFGFSTNGLLHLAVDDDAQRGIEWTGGKMPGIDILVEADLSNKELQSDAADLEAKVDGSVFFRGHLSKADTKVVIHRRPSNHLVSNPAPDAANLAIVASPELHQRFGSGDAAISIVLDASGSMGAAAGQPFGPQTKYAEAVRALDRLLETIPDGTQVSVWTFGQAMGSQKTVVEAERTIQQLVPPIIWNSKDKSQYQKLTNAITYPQVEPWNESPILRAMISAKGDLAGVNGPKTMLVITDGADNRFANDSTVNPRGRSVAEALFDIFDGSGISIQVVGFKVVSAEAAMAQKQFELVEQLYPPGGFYLIDRVEALEAHLANVLSRRLTFVTALPRQRAPGPEHPIGDVGGGQIWLTPMLKPGRLAIETPVDPALAPTIFLQRGDLMLLQLTSQGDQLSLKTADYLAQRFSDRPTMTSAGWKSALLQNRLNGDQLQLMLGLQQQDLQLGEMSVIKPTRVWFNVGRPDGKYAASSVIRQDGFPMATYSISAADWPVAGNTTAPTVSAWWSSEDDNLGVVLRQTNDYAALEAIHGKQVETDAGQVQILGVNIELTQCIGADGKPALTRRLAIRTQAAPGEIVWCEPIGYKPAGIEIKAFREIGAATSYFWPLPEGNVDEIVAGLRIVALKDFQRHAELRGQYVQFNELAVPATRDFAPRPALRLLNSDGN